MPGAGRADAHHDVVVADRLEVLPLAGGLGRDDPAQAGQDDLLVAAGHDLRRLTLGREPGDVVRRDFLAHPGQVDQALRHRGGALDLLGGSAQGQGVAPQRDPDPEGPLELEEVAVVDPGEEQGIGAFDRETVRRFVGQAVLLT